MISQLEKEIIFRFLKARKKDGFLNVISIFSFIGIGLGVAVLIIVMSVMNGFRTELINKIVGFNAHAVVKPYDKPLVHIIEKDFAKGIVSNDGEAVILSKENTKGILLKGYLKNDFKKLEISNNQKYFGTTDLKYNSISKWDSVGHMNMIAKLEQEFKISMEMDDIIDFSSFKTGIKILKKYKIKI